MLGKVWMSGFVGAPNTYEIDWLGLHNLTDCVAHFAMS